MASRHRRDYKRKKRQQFGFRDSDFEWLANKFKKEVKRNSELTIEAFAARHGIEAKWIRRFIEAHPTDETTTLSVEGASHYYGVNVGVIRKWMNTGALRIEGEGNDLRIRFDPEYNPTQRTFWHGTTEDRAKSIVEKGFQAKFAQTRGVWFTRQSSYATKMANLRSRQRDEMPVVIACDIDLRKYNKFDQRGPSIYVFFMSIGKDVVRNVASLNPPEKLGKQMDTEKPSEAPIDIVVTQAGGKIGALMWVNRYLETRRTTCH